MKETIFLKFFIIGLLFSTALVLALQTKSKNDSDFKPVNIYLNITRLNENFETLTNEVQVRKSWNFRGIVKLFGVLGPNLNTFLNYIFTIVWPKRRDDRGPLDPVGD